MVKNILYRTNKLWTPSCSRHYRNIGDDKLDRSAGPPQRLSAPPLAFIAVNTWYPDRFEGSPP